MLIIFTSVPLSRKLLHFPGSDTRFPIGGGANPPGGCQHMILPNFPKNCLKLRNFSAVRGAPPLDAPLLPSKNNPIE